ncbi:hypothetical protein MGI18_11605 [Bacillus sp. OVS6]|nr:hypothetical protein MGI18_11605 [Bacillus sp. OVS6]
MIEPVDRLSLSKLAQYESLVPHFSLSTPGYLAKTNAVGSDQSILLFYLKKIL